MTPAPAPNYQEEPAIYTYQVALTANQRLQNQNIPIDPDSDFLLTGIHGTSTGRFTVNLRLPSGRSLSNVAMSDLNLIGTANQPTAIGPAPVYVAGGIGPALELLDTSGAGNTLEICFSGIRRFRV
jgi:hypothetical protein